MRVLLSHAPGTRTKLLDTHIHTSPWLIPQMLRRLFLAPHSSCLCVIIHEACSYSGLCSGVKQVVDEQRRQGVFGSFLSGLQDNLAKAASPWITAVFGKNNEDPVYPLLDATPFDPSDPGAVPVPSTAGSAQPGLNTVRGERA